MSVKVKRGLGLLVVAVLAWIAEWFASQMPTGNAGLDVLQAGLVIALLLVLLGAFLGGLVLIAWGLLRD